MTLEPKTGKPNKPEEELEGKDYLIGAIVLVLFMPVVYYADLNTTGYVFLVGLMCTDVWLVVIFLAFQYI